MKPAKLYFCAGVIFCGINCARLPEMLIVYSAAVLRPANIGMGDAGKKQWRCLVAAGICSRALAKDAARI